MRRLIGGAGSLLLAGALLVATEGCKKRKTVHVETTEESGGGLASTVITADPKASVQLLKGFYDVEQNSWRWTMGKFSVTLRPPLNAPQKGATLNLKFAIPDPVISRVKSVTLTANIGGTTLPGETYTRAGEYTYTKDVPASAFGGEAVTVEFALDHYLTPGTVDQRELGVVVSSIGLEAK